VLCGMHMCPGRGWVHLDLPLTSSWQRSCLPADTVALPSHRDDARGQAGQRAAHLSLEHGAAVRILFGAGAPNAACALLRSQYEAAVRGAWAVDAASNEKIDKLNRPLDLDSEQAANNLDDPEKMLNALEARAGINAQLMGMVVPLDEIRLRGALLHLPP
jgi:hypothetical protein